MNIGSIMTKDVVTIDIDTSLKTMYGIFNLKKFHHLLVVENNELKGVISDRDVLKALSPFLNTIAEQSRDLFTLKKRAHQIMSRNLITVTKEADLEEAVRLMLQENVSCLPVTSSDGQIEGVVTWKDLLNAFSHGSMLADSVKAG
jgi:acetoin utilization protein AcuB